METFILDSFKANSTFFSKLSKCTHLKVDSKFGYHSHLEFEGIEYSVTSIQLDFPDLHTLQLSIDHQVNIQLNAPSLVTLTLGGSNSVSHEQLLMQCNILKDLQLDSLELKGKFPFQPTLEILFSIINHFIGKVITC